MVILVTALDPGITTGYAIGLIDENGFMKVKAGQKEFTHLGLWDWLTQKQINHLICESFQFRKTGKGQQAANLYPVEMIGVVKLYIEQCGFEENPPKLHMQRPELGKDRTYFTDEKLKEEELYIPGKEHSRDATRHLLQWFTFGFGYQFNKEGFGPYEGE